MDCLVLNVCDNWPGYLACVSLCVITSQVTRLICVCVWKLAWSPGLFVCVCVKTGQVTCLAWVWELARSPGLFVCMCKSWPGHLVCVCVKYGSPYLKPGIQKVVASVWKDHPGLLVKRLPPVSLFLKKAAPLQVMCVHQSSDRKVETTTDNDWMYVSQYSTTVQRTFGDQRRCTIRVQNVCSDGERLSACWFRDCGRGHRVSLCSGWWMAVKGVWCNSSFRTSTAVWKCNELVYSRE